MRVNCVAVISPNWHQRFVQNSSLWMALRIVMATTRCQLWQSLFCCFVVWICVADNHCIIVVVLTVRSSVLVYRHTCCMLRDSGPMHAGMCRNTAVLACYVTVDPCKPVCAGTLPYLCVTWRWTHASWYAHFHVYMIDLLTLLNLRRSCWWWCCSY